LLYGFGGERPGGVHSPSPISFFFTFFFLLHKHKKGEEKTWEAKKKQRDCKDIMRREEDSVLAILRFTLISRKSSINRTF